MRRLLSRRSSKHTFGDQMERIMELWIPFGSINFCKMPFSQRGRFRKNARNESSSKYSMVDFTPLPSPCEMKYATVSHPADARFLVKAFSIFLEVRLYLFLRIIFPVSLLVKYQYAGWQYMYTIVSGMLIWGPKFCSSLHHRKKKRLSTTPSPLSGKLSMEFILRWEKAKNASQMSMVWRADYREMYVREIHASSTS